MALQILGADNVTVGAVDAGHQAQRVSMRPMPVLAWSSFGLASGILPTGLAAAAPLFSLRNTGSNLIAIRRLMVGFQTTTAFTAAQRIELALQVARGFSVADSGGTAVTNASGKHRASLGTPNIDARIAATAALTPGTRTLDANFLGLVAGGSTGLATGLPPTPIFSHDTGDYPLVLANQEGIVLSNNVLTGAAGAIVVYVNLELAEVSPAVWA